MNEIVNSSNNILKQYEDLSPINLVDTVERYYHTFLPNQNKDSLNILSSYKAKNNVKFKLLDFEHKKKLSPLLQQKIKKIQTMKIFGDYLFLSDTSGSIFMYSVSREAEIKIMTPPGKIDYYATSIDASPNAECVIGGYSNGYLILWDTKKPSIIHTIKDLHNSKIILGQFYQITEKKKFEVISSDMSGKLLKFVYTNSLFKKSVQDFMIYKDDVPTYAMTHFKPLKNKQVIIGAFCNINKIRVYILHPIFVSFFEVERPDCYDENCTDVPDISFGWGCEPFENDTDNNVTKLDEIQRQNQILLAVSWSQVIRIYSMNIKDEDMILNGEGAKCHFINNIPVIRLGFISPSIIYFFDKNAEIKIINTAYTQYGEYHQEKKGEFIYNKRALVEEGKIIDKDLIKINVDNFGKRELLCYRYFINNMSKCIYLCTENGFYLGKVLNFEDCVINLTKEDWIAALSLTIDIYQGNITSFPDIPLLKHQRIKVLRPFITSLLEKYINVNLADDKKIEEKDIIKCINVVIEFCIGIKEIEFLFKNAEKSFRKKGKSDLFYKLLEPFIFNDLLINENISEESLISLYTTYKSNNSLPILQHLLTHLNYNCLFSSTIKRIAFKDNLFSLMILLFSNGKNYENLFLPIARMYKVFEEKIKSKENFEFKSYVDTFGNEEIEGINKMEESTEYIGHKLLWYIDMSLKGNKFSLGMDINLLKFDKESKDYQNFIAFIFYWILQENIFLNLIKFDSYSFLNIISQYFSDPTLLNIIKSYDFSQFSESMISKLNEENEIKFLTDSNTQSTADKNESQIPKQEQESTEKKTNINYNNTLEVINYILKITENISSFFINIDISILIIKFAFKYSEKTPLPAAFKRNVTESFKKLLTFYDDYNKLKEKSPNDIRDIFNCHKVNKISGDKNKDNLFFNEIYKCLRDLIDSNYRWRKDDLNSILEISKNTSYTLVKIRLFEYTKNYEQAINCYLDEESQTESHSEDVFAWLQRMFQAFSRKNEDLNEIDFKNLQDTVVDNVGKLAKISIAKTNKIIKQFYGNDQKIIIIHKLDDAPLLQYEFIKQLLSPTRGGGGRLEEVKNEEKKEETEENENLKNAKNESLSNILLLEIDLLIKLKKFKEVLPSVMEKLTLYPSVYPKEKCLKKCVENNINDASVLLYQSLGETEKAMELTKNSVEKSFEEYLKDKGEEKYNKFLEELNLRIKLCEDTSEFIEKNNIFSDDNVMDNKIIISQKEIEDIWFNILYQLYEFEKRAENEEIIVKKMKENINKLLRKMCLHVKLRNIIEVVINKKENSLFKDFQNILCEMIKSNNNFNRILTNTMTIMKNCAINSEEIMFKECIKGNYYNNEKCDVCFKDIDIKNDEKIFCFGCGHQCHELCAYNKGEDYESECPICKEKEIIDEPIIKNKNKPLNQNAINIIEEKTNDINNREEDNIINENQINVIREDRIKKLNNFDNSYLALIEDI